MTVFRKLIAAAAATLVMTGAALAGPHIKIFDGTRAGGAHGDEIEILSWSWGETNDSTRPPREGPGILRVEARAGKHSDEVARWQRERTRLPAVQFVSGEQKSQDSYMITLKNVYISSYQTSSGDTVPVESVTLNFSKIEWER